MAEKRRTNMWIKMAEKRRITRGSRWRRRGGLHLDQYGGREEDYNRRIKVEEERRTNKTAEKRMIICGSRWRRTNMWIKMAEKRKIMSVVDQDGGEEKDYRCCGSRSRERLRMLWIKIAERRKITCVVDQDQEKDYVCCGSR
jgi:hypothetical protein